MTKLSPSVHIYQQFFTSCFYHIRDLQCIRHYLDLDSAKLLATALVSNRLNYCNSLLYGMADTDLTKVSTYSELIDPLDDKVTSVYLQCSTSSFPSLVAIKVWNIVQDMFGDLQNAS